MKKRFFANHAKSSAALISLGIHAILIVIAFTFVAVTVITKEEQAFETKHVKRPKMPIKKLQVPVNVKKKKSQKPKLRKRIVVQPKMNQTMPDIKMPEITGVKGGMGSGVGDSLGGGGGVGFSMPEIEIFGIKGKGEKIFLILDTGNHMLIDEMGGIPAYTIIKNELIRIVEELPPTALFNICVFGGGERTLFPTLVSANSANAAKAKAWLDPLNSAADSAKSGLYGIKTLGSEGSHHKEDLRIGKFAEPIKKNGPIYGGKWGGDAWYKACMLSMLQQADTVFLLSNDWSHQRVAISEVPSVEEWIATTSAGKKWDEKVKEGYRLLEEENKRRKAEGQPPKVVSGGRWGIQNEYFPGIQRPPTPEYYYFKPQEFAEAMVMMKDKHRPDVLQSKSGLGKNPKKGKVDFSFNVVQFVKANGEPSDRAVGNFKKLTSLCRGQYQTVAGMDEIQNYVSSH
ncbi:hypothetical protein PDESU_05179 [Pontiella desulfatans]|uniref:VWFA domain-containing protein n=1 Tax=Pontiella desulfatans TaxID=2750659 RepID=A0A6C2U912_PONDE|nr:hypothetical protein [Pontiella desulfatans]VGO16588.1 hypothetical protein PDESU_05179 [Pontiella desulfatans]